MPKFAEKNLEMSEAEMGKIALAYIRAKVEKRLHLNSQIRREIGESAKQVNIALDRATMFAEILCRESMEKAFSKAK